MMYGNDMTGDFMFNNDIPGDFMFDNDMSRGFIFDLIPFFVMVVFALVLGTILYAMFKGLKQRKKDNASPVLSVIATVVDKRQHMWSSMGTEHSSSSTHTEYYVTFEVESGSRMELKIPVDQFGFIVKGDYGKLTFQGSRFLGFERQ